MEGKKKLLIVLLLILGASVAYQFWGSSNTNDAGPARPERTGEQGPAVKIEDYVVRMDLLASSVDALEGAKVANIFTSVSRPAPSGTSSGKRETEKTPSVASPPALEQAAAPVAPPPPPKTPEQLEAERVTQDMERIRFLGFVRKGGGRSVFLGQGNELLVVGEGEMVKGLYNITQIEKDYLVLSDPKTKTEKKIEMKGK